MTLEEQHLTCGATNGTFRLSFRGEVTEPLAFDISAKALELALESLETIGNVSVVYPPQLKDQFCSADNFTTPVREQS